MDTPHDDPEDWKTYRRGVIENQTLFREEIEKIKDRVRNLEMKIYAALALLEIAARVAEHYLK